MTAAPMTAATRRPMAVFAAAYLLCGAAALWTAAAITTLFALPQFSRYYSDLRGDADAGPAVASLLVSASAVAMLAAGGCVLLAVQTARGFYSARVITWSLIAVAACTASGILIADPSHAVPWHRQLNTIVAIMTLTFAGVAAVLLVLPVSRTYLRAMGEARKYRRMQAAAVRRPQMPYPPAPNPQRPYPPAPNPQRPYPPPRPGPNAPHAQPPAPAWPPPTKPPEA